MRPRNLRDRKEITLPAKWQLYSTVQRLQSLSSTVLALYLPPPGILSGRGGEGGEHVSLHSLEH